MSPKMSRAELAEPTVTAEHVREVDESLLSGFQLDPTTGVVRR